MLHVNSEHVAHTWKKIDLFGGENHRDYSLHANHRVKNDTNPTGYQTLDYARISF